MDGYIYSVNLVDYTQGSDIVRVFCWAVFVILIVIGIVKILLSQCDVQKGQRILTGCSICLSVFLVLFLAMTRQAYATIVVFLLLVIKTILLLRDRRI